MRGYFVMVMVENFNYPKCSRMGITSLKNGLHTVS